MKLARTRPAALLLAPLLGLTLLAPPATSSPQGGYSSCGVLEQGVTCPKLFRDTQGALWLLDDYGGFGVGAQVHVSGTPDPTCANICMQGNGCIYGAQVTACLPDPTTPYCFCSSGAPCGNTDPTAGCVNSTGKGARLSGAGSTSVAADDLVLTASQLPTGVLGLFFMGSAQTAKTFGAGQLCVLGGASGLYRYPVLSSGTPGSFQFGPVVGYAAASFPASGHILPGSTWNFQAWYRDPSGPCAATHNLTNATQAVFVP